MEMIVLQLVIMNSVLLPRLGLWKTSSETDCHAVSASESRTCCRCFALHYTYVCCVQLPELASAHVRMKNPDRVSAVIRSMIANGSQRLQVWLVMLFHQIRQWHWHVTSSVQVCNKKTKSCSGPDNQVQCASMGAHLTKIDTNGQTSGSCSS